MTYELSRMHGTGRLAFLHGYAIGMSKYDQPLSLEDVHDTAEMLMAELDAAIKEIEAKSENLRQGLAFWKETAETNSWPCEWTVATVLKEERDAARQELKRLADAGG